MSKPVIAKLKKTKNGGIRIQLWRSSDMIFSSEVLQGGVAKIEKFIIEVEKAIREHGITIEKQ